MSESIGQISGASMDIAAQKRAELKQLFPAAFSEDSLDFERLKAELGTFTEIFESRRERYSMDWHGKQDALKVIQARSFATLKPCRDESVNFDTTENLFIEGDNLEVLKLLQKSYYGKVKMIYIDPPYNTGNEFIYPDNFSESLDTYLQYAGLADSTGKKFTTNTASDGRYHTKWLNMMYPRLYLARNLLSDDGVIFISIDDNEVHNLRKLCDEVFGEGNFVAQIVWERAYAPINLKKHFSESHDYIVCYSKNIDLSICNGLPRSDSQNKDYRNLDNDPRGRWKSGNPSVGPAVEKNIYEITSPSGRKMLPPSGRSWLYSQDRFEELKADNRIYWGASGDNIWAPKLFLSEVKDGITPMTIWRYTDVGHSQDATKRLKELFDDKDFFDYPKPVDLIKRCLTLYSQPDSIILDFFAGSATTAHAVMELNAEDGGQRKFIMVQLPEPCDEKSEAGKAGFKTIADIGKERIRRAISKIKQEQDSELGLGGTKDIDLGFKVLKLHKSNFKQWQELPPDATVDQIQEQLELHVDHIQSEATPEDLLYELLLKSGFMPSDKIESRVIANKTVYDVAEGRLLLCLEKEVTKELIDAVSQMEIVRFVCLDSAFQGNDQLKANAVQTFAARNMGRESESQIVFQTV